MHPFELTSLLLASLSLALPAPARAEVATEQASQNDSSGDTVCSASGCDRRAISVDEEPIIVIALPPPVAADAYGVEHLSQEALRNSASGGIEGTLATIAGFQQFRRSDSRSSNVSAQGITLRAIGGNATSRTLLVRDGVPVADAFFGFIPFATLPVEEIASVRVTRGSGTGPFGAGAVAGVIELDSAALSQRPSLAFGLTGGSRNSLQADGAIIVSLGAGHVALDAHHDRGDGFFTTPPNQRVAATVPARYQTTTLSLAASAPVDANSTLSARVGLFRDERTLRFAGADNEARGVDASIRLVSTGGWQWEALAWIQARDFSNIVVSATSFRATLDQRDTPTTGLGAKLELRPPVGANRTLRIGIDARVADGIATEDVLATSGARTLTRRAGGTSQVAGGYVEGDAHIGAISLTAGARVDHWRLDDGALLETRTDGSVQTATAFIGRAGTIASLRGGIGWAVSDQLTLRSSAYSGFRIPTLNELYRGFTVFPVVTRANADLRPERLVGAEVGVEWRPFDGASMTLTGFDNHLRNAIANVTIATNARQRRNIEGLRTRGIEVALGLSQGPWRLDANWSFSNARLRPLATDSAAAALAGLRPAQSPVHAGGAALSWLGHAGASAHIGVRHIGAQFEDDRNIDRLPPATIVDAVIRYPLGHGLVASARGENLFNVDVVTRNAAGSIDLGNPRTIWLGLQWAIR